MDTAARFNWASLGKADYSQAAALVASLPGPIRQRMTGHDKELQCRLLFLCWKYSATNGRQRASAIPSETYLARVICRSVRTVRRCLEHLKSLGLLVWCQQKGKWNEWKTNVYAMGKTFLAVLYARCGRKVQHIHRGPKMADYDLKKGIEAAPDTQALASHSPFVTKLRDKLLALGSAQQAVVARSVEEEKKQVEERKILLRAQAEQLKARGL